MGERIGEKALKRNPALEPLAVLVGEWTTEGTHPHLPGVVLHGRVVFEWIEGGAFMVTRSELDDARFPQGVGVFGSDDAMGELFMLYFDTRDVSRKYNVSMRDNVWKWWRDEPGFSQRFTGTIMDGGNTIVSKGEMSRDGGAWEDDLGLTYTRTK